MTDLRFRQMANRLDHVYFDRESMQNDQMSSPEVVRARLFEEFKSMMVGGADPRKFLDKAFHKWAAILGQLGEGDMTRTYGAVPPTATYKQFIKDPLVKILNEKSVLGMRPSGDIAFCDRADLSEPKRHIMPDIVAVNERFLSVVEESKSSDKPLEIDDMGLVEFFITVQPSREDDFFHDSTPGMEHLFDPKNPTLETRFTLLDHISDPEDRKKAKIRLQKMLERVADMWGQQWRSHVFTISIAGSMARFLTWTRSGILITRAFDIRREPKLLTDFLVFYYHSSREDRGFLAIIHTPTGGIVGEPGKGSEETGKKQEKPRLMKMFVVKSKSAEGVE